MFDNVVYLNRDQDTDRKEATEKQFLEHGIKATRFAALNHDMLQDLVVEPISSLGMNTAQTSCLISHLEIIRLYGGKELLVFEDDIDLSPSHYWGTSFDDLISSLTDSIGIAQLYAYPSQTPVLPKWWSSGTFGTIAYFIRPWYAKKLIDIGYKDGKWSVKEFACKYSQPVADAILYSNTPAVSVTLFGLRPVPSTILPNTTYFERASVCGQSWSQGINSADDIKTALVKFK